MHMPIPTLILHDDTAEKLGLFSAGCHDRSKDNHHSKKILSNQKNTLSLIISYA